LSLGGTKCIVQKITTNSTGKKASIAARTKFIPLAPNRKEMNPEMTSEAKIWEREYEYDTQR